MYTIEDKPSLLSLAASPPINSVMLFFTPKESVACV